MSPDEVLSSLRELGVNVTRKTLLNYEAYNLPKPDRGSGGRGVGRFTDYPPETVGHAFAIYHMLNSSYYPSSYIIEITKIIPVFLKNPFLIIERLWGSTLREKCKTCEYDEKCDKTGEFIQKDNDLFSEYLDRNFLTPILIYLTYMMIVRTGINPNEPINIKFAGGDCYGVDIVVVNKIHFFRYNDALGDFEYEIDYSQEEDSSSSLFEETIEKGIAKYVFINRLTGVILQREVVTRLNKK